MGPLTENHKCPKGILSRLAEALSPVGIGGIIGVGFCFAIEERPPAALLAAGAALGAVLASAVRQAVSGRP